MTTRYLVTGAAGFIGSHLCERLLNDGNLVRGVDRFSAYYPRAVKQQNLQAISGHGSFELVEADLAGTNLSTLLDGVDGVFHLAAQPGVRGSWGDGFAEYVRDNVLATQRLLEGLVDHGVPVVIASSSSVYGDTDDLPVTERGTALRPLSPYGLTKLAVEHLARIYVAEHRIHAVLLRYFTVYGPRQRPDMAFSRFIRAALRDDPIRVLGDGEQSRDFSFVSDVVDATIRATGAPAGRVYNVGGGEPVSLNSVLTTLAALVGRPLTVTREAPSPGDVRHTWADTTLARQELGWEPATGLEEGLAAQLVAQSANGDHGDVHRRDDRTVPASLVTAP